MKRQLLLLACWAIATSLSAQTTVIRAQAYLDVRSGELVEPANILIEDGLIRAVNPASVPDSAEQINLPGKILLPGLMDMHVHLDADFETGLALSLVTESTSKRTLRAAQNAETTLMAGFTTVRNVGQTQVSPELIDVALAEASAEGWIKAPRIIPCGHMIGITGGHADPSMFGGFAEGVMELTPEYGIADGVDEVLKATRFQIKHGARAIKFMATAGVLTLEGGVGNQQLSAEEMKTIVDEAARHGITVAAHAHGTEGIIAAVKAGVNSIEHGSFLNDEAVRLMKERGTFLVPTIALLNIVDITKLPPVMAAKAREAMAGARGSYEKAVAAGVNFALGTDAPLVPHGQNAREFQAMVDVGLEPLKAIQAGTINAALLLKLEDRGEIKTGLLADIIAVDADPLADISTLENVKFVMKGGRVYKLEE